MNEAAEMQRDLGAEKALFAFDEEFTEVRFNATPKADKPNYIWHRLRRPSFNELAEWDKASTWEVIDQNQRESEVFTENEAGHIKLWNTIIDAVKGYTECPADWISPTEQHKEKIWPGQKVAAINAKYASSCVVEDLENGISLTEQEWIVRQSIGLDPENPDFTVRYTIRQPNEAERREFRKSASSTTQLKGRKKAHYRMASNLKAYVKLFDALVVGIEGGTVAGKQWDGDRRFLAGIDPMFKRSVIVNFMNSLDAELQD